MATVDTSKLYLISTTYTDQRMVLASSAHHDTVVVVEPESPDAQQFQEWRVSMSEFLGFYHLSTTQQSQNGRSLDVIDENGRSQAPAFSPTGYYTGQFWRLELSVNGTYRLSNNFTGPDRYLNGASESLLPELTLGDSPSQHWTLKEVVTETSVSTTQTPDIPFATPSTSRIPDPDGIATNPGRKLAGTALVGVAIGGGVILTLALGVGFVVFISYRRTRRLKKKIPTRPAPPFRERSYTAKWHDGELPLPRYEATLGNDISDEATADLPHRNSKHTPTE